MSNKLPTVSGDQVIRFFCKKFGFSAQPGGRHYKLKGMIKDKLRVFPVPMHKELAKSTFLSIIQESGLSRDEFLRLWHER